MPPKIPPMYHAFKAYHFEVEDQNGTKLSVARVQHTATGLELEKVHLREKPTLFAEILELNITELRVRMYTSHNPDEGREIVYRVGAPKHLAVMLDIYADEMVPDRVLFTEAEVIRIRDFAG